MLDDEWGVPLTNRLGSEPAADRGGMAQTQYVNRTLLPLLLKLRYCCYCYAATPAPPLPLPLLLLLLLTH